MFEKVEVTNFLGVKRWYGVKNEGQGVRSYGDPSTDFRAKFPLFYMFGKREWNELHPEPRLRLL